MFRRCASNTWQAREYEETKLIGADAFYLFERLPLIYAFELYEPNYLSHTFPASSARTSPFSNASPHDPLVLPLSFLPLSLFDTAKQPPCLPLLPLLLI